MSGMTSSPLARQPLQEKIGFALGVLRYCVENQGIQKLLSINTVAETFFKEFLSILFDLTLENLNSGPNFPAVDLGDKGARVCFQVTSDGKKTKVKKTLATFADSKHNLAADFDSLRIFVIGKRQKSYDGLAIPTGVVFDPTNDVLDIPSVLRMLPQLKIEKLELLADLIDKEMPLFKTASAVERQTDQESLEVYRSHFERRALYDSWGVEADVGDFRDAVDDLLGLVTMGIVKGIPVAKSKAKLQDPQLQEAVERVHLKLIHLRQLYTLHERLGDINPDTNWGNFHDHEMCHAFDTYKQDVLDEMNNVLTSRSIRPLQGVMHPRRHGRP